MNLEISLKSSFKLFKYTIIMLHNKSYSRSWTVGVWFWARSWRQSLTKNKYSAYTGSIHAYTASYRICLFSATPVTAIILQARVFTQSGLLTTSNHCDNKCTVLHLRVSRLLEMQLSHLSEELVW